MNSKSRTKRPHSALHITELIPITDPARIAAIDRRRREVADAAARDTGKRKHAKRK